MENGKPGIVLAGSSLKQAEAEAVRRRVTAGKNNGITNGKTLKFSVDKRSAPMYNKSVCESLFTLFTRYCA